MQPLSPRALHATNRKRYYETINRNLNLVTIATYNMLFINDIVHALLIDLDPHIRRSPQFKFGIKRTWQRLMTQRRNDERMINEVTGEKNGELIATLNDRYSEAVNHYIDTFTMTIKQVLDKHHVDHALLYAKAETARYLCDISVKQYDYWMNQFVARDPHLSMVNTLHYLRLMEVHRLMETLTTELFRPFQNFALPDDPQCALAAQIVLNKLRDPDITYQVATSQDEENI